MSSGAWLVPQVDPLLAWQQVEGGVLDYGKDNRHIRCQVCDAVGLSERRALAFGLTGMSGNSDLRLSAGC